MKARTNEKELWDKLHGPLASVEVVFFKKARELNATVDDSNYHDWPARGIEYVEQSKIVHLQKGVVLTLVEYKQPPKYRMYIYATSCDPLKELLSSIPFLGKHIKKPPSWRWEEQIAVLSIPLRKDRVESLIDEGLKRLKDIDHDFLVRNHQ